MSSEWQRVEIGQLAKLRSGFPFKSADWKDSGIPVIKIANIKGGRIIPDGCGFVSTEVASKSAEWFTRTGDVLIAMTGYVGEVAQVKPVERYLINQRVGRFDFTPNAEVEPTYFFYHLQHPDTRAEIEGVARGSAQPNLSAGDAHKIKITLPPLAVQREIAATLGALDDRISLLRETNTTLEAIAQALFKSWFVDFDPVRAKMEGRAPEGMDEATAVLFPDSFEETELGAVPKGWAVRSLDEIASYLNGLALQKFPPTGQDDLPVIKIAQLRKGDTLGADRASRAIKPEYIIQNGDVLFSWSGSLEVEIWCGGEGALNQHLFKVASALFPKWFYFLWTRHHLEHFRQVAASKATTMGHIQRSHLTAAKVVVPTDAVIHMADAVLAPILQRMIENALQAQTLSTLRDTLLPRLISGQLLLSDSAGLFVEHA